ncbi:hypothetical protein B0H13DRAFT_2072707 [Mycena leptocephala]|nr:hypothetical protein B0H13DRAFT_2072707 [Mycena leptocephala]
MLLLLLLVHLSSNSISGHRNALDARASEPDSCDDINHCRRLFDIVWGCATTIFACTWVSVHPNIPPSNQTRLSLFGRRLRLMLFAMIAPELMVGFAARQFLVAREFSKDFNVSKTHGFFFSMGGFVSQDRRHHIARLRDFEGRLGREYILAIQNVDEEDIMDKSKGDVLSKGVALAQGLWFTAQWLARVVQHLPVTELEVATMAFAVVNVFIWILWWGKPLDVQRPIPVGPAVDPRVDSPETYITVSILWTVLNKVRSALTGTYGGTRYPMKSIPAFWSVENSEGIWRSSRNIALAVECLTGTIFGAIHCAAWTAAFPSPAEMWLWRSSSLAIVAIPVVLGLLASLQFLNCRINFYDILNYTLKSTLPIYILSRLILLTLPFTTLRALPTGSFVDVDWTVYIPHL